MSHDHGGDTTDGSMDMDMDGMMMKMYFHFGKSETVLFEFWKTEKTVVFVFSLLIIYLLAFSYEALKYWRDQLFHVQVERNRTSLGVSSSTRSKVLNGFHLVQTLLHMVQFVLSYLLMLIFMTYNVWLALAVTLGAGTGYFCFGWNKLSSHDITEHCQ